MSGVGWPLAIWFAIDQILRLAPSMRPDMEPVVSSTKATSMRGGFAATGAMSGVAGAASAGALRPFAWATRAVAASRMTKVAMCRVRGRWNMALLLGLFVRGEARQGYTGAL